MVAHREQTQASSREIIQITSENTLTHNDIKNPTSLCSTWDRRSKIKFAIKARPQAPNILKNLLNLRTVVFASNEDFFETRRQVRLVTDGESKIHQPMHLG